MAKKENVDRAGVIPYYVGNGELELMFMKPSDPNFGGKKFQIAKGRIDKGEKPEVSAFREAKEELGLFEPNVEHSEKLGKFNDLHVYIAKVKDKNMFGEPHYETEAVAWYTPEQFQADGRNWQKPIVQAAVRKIKKLENL